MIKEKENIYKSHERFEESLHDTRCSRYSIKGSYQRQEEIL
jgi:hypothetical protein